MTKYKNSCSSLQRNKKALNYINHAKGLYDTNDFSDEIKSIYTAMLDKLVEITGGEDNGCEN